MGAGKVLLTAISTMSSGCRPAAAAARAIRPFTACKLEAIEVIISKGRTGRRQAQNQCLAEQSSSETFHDFQEIIMDISELLAFVVKNKASDLHLSAGLPPMIRVHGDVRRINLPA